MSKRILFVSLYDPTKSGSGPGNHLRYLSKSLRDQGCEVHILLLGAITKNVKIDDIFLHYVRTLPFGGGFLFSLTSIGIINQIIKTYKIDIVHGQSPSSFGYALLSRNKPPFVVTVHGTSFGEILSLTNTPVSCLTSKILTDLSLIQPLTAVLTTIEYKFADKLIVVSGNVAKEVESFYHISPRKISVVYNGIVPTNITAVDTLSNHNILFVGRLIWRKGLKYLLEALPKVLAEYPDTQLIIVGSGEQSDALKELVKALKITKSVQFLGTISDEELNSLFHKTNIYAQPSLYEPLGMAIMEAMSHSKPVIASNIGGIPELVANGTHGILVEPANSLQLSEAIINLFGNPAVAKNNGDNGREKMCEFFWNKIAYFTNKVYDDLFYK